MYVLYINVKKTTFIDTVIGDVFAHCKTAKSVTCHYVAYNRF